MPRARTPTLALLLAAGISVVGPNLIEPEPVAAPWSDTTAGANSAHDTRNIHDTRNTDDTERSTTCHAS